MLLNCKFCGGDLDVTEGTTIAECKYCRTKQTLPKEEDDSIRNLFNRANALRRRCEFDKAEAIYEKIIEAVPNESEAYYGLVLCKYGIEYVDDRVSGKMIPTCHRASYDSIIADGDFKSALEYADGARRVLYEEQAREIDRIQRDILALAQNEEGYDVFICYKETDENGGKTRDSVIANDIYYELTDAGYKVFYAAITLEGKLGQDYEPIIFAALNSAKVMLVLGTKQEYFNAVWVKNEWSRYLKIIKEDRKKLLIPCYRDMDAYDLPDEFAHLQAQDMSKIGFVNDLIRGIKKVMESFKPKQDTVVREIKETTIIKEPVIRETAVIRDIHLDKVQIDGLAGINDLVRSTLSKLITLDFNGAEKELMECERINHASVGTLIAKVSIPLFKSFYSKDRQEELAKANNFLQKLARDFPEIDEREQILYNFIDSADIYALLYVVYGMTGQTKRKEMIFGMLRCNEVYNANVIKYLLNTLLKDKRTEAADQLIGKFRADNSRIGVSTVLTAYPSNEKKAAHVKTLLSKINPETDLSKIFDTYFSTTKDGSDVVVGIFLGAVQYKVTFNTGAVISSVLKSCNSAETASALFNALGNKRLEEKTAKAIMEWCIKECGSCTVSGIGFKALFDSNSIFEITDEEIIKVCNSKQPEQVKEQKVIQMLNTFKMTNKSMDKLIAFHLLENAGTYEYRKKLFDCLSAHLVSIPFNVLEAYALRESFEGEQKHVILKEAFLKSKTLTLGSAVVSKYLSRKVDNPEIREEVICTFLSMNLLPDPDAVSAYLTSQGERRSDRVLDLMISKSCKAKSDTFDRYIRGLGDYRQYNKKIAKIATQSGFILSAQSFWKYLLNIEETDGGKAELVSKYYQTCSSGVKTMEITAKVGNTELSGNVAQIYMLVGNDDQSVMREIIGMLQRDKIKLDAPVTTLSNGKKVKLHKFVKTNGGEMSEKALALAKELL